MNLPAGFDVEEIASGCCGMAGSFGYEREHYDVSMTVGRERLFDVIEAEGDVEVAATGTSCRHQIADATGRKARHWAEVLADALP
jgi:Fe-S oxidoreductase